MSSSVPEFAVVCEARADKETACGLADRVLMEEIDWLDESNLEHCLRWRGTVSAEPFLKWASVREECKGAGLNKGIFGRFGEQPGGPDAHSARKVLLLLAGSAQPPDAVVLVRDSDGDARRRVGLEQARDAQKWPFPVLIALAEPKRECWVLVGFTPKTKEEEQRLATERQRLSFDPVRDAHLLTAREHGAKKDAKKALETLIPKEEDPKREREHACLKDTPLETLSERGTRTGLTAYIKGVRDQLVPILKGQR